ncbi:WD40/YVTN/BNR-like repeat-containing protein [Limnobacter sp.]|uniref:WD40/YVTN/BNR-like repeat-containing protein n=1 Tax=Limnobacter sp. TaxID=2003368 RepID=UPI00391BBD82
MSKPLLRAALLAFGLCAGQVSYAFKDPLDLPAIQAPKAAKALLLNATSLGSQVLLVGERGIILKRDFTTGDVAQGVKDNEGKLWTQAKVPVSVNLTGVQFVNDSLAFVVGHDGVVLKSTDAGASWTKVFDGIKANEQVVAAAKKKMDDMQSRYDAASPAEQDKMNEALEAATFAFEDAEAGARFGPARPMLDVWFKDANTGWVVGSYGQIFETNDGGSTWTLIANRLDNPDFRHYNGLYGDETGLMLIAGEAGRVYISNDFGATWTRSDTGYNGHFYGTVVTRNDQGQPIVFAYGFGGNVYRLGAGATAWWQLKSPTKESLVQGITVGKTALFVDQKGRLVSTDETGTVLKMVSAEEGKPVTGMALVNNTLVLSGQNGPRTIAMPR